MEKDIRLFKKKTLWVYCSLLLFVVCLLALIASISPLGKKIEETVGLNALFELRGVRQPPDGIVIISVDRRSADQLNLPGQLRKWPRKVYADLLDVLQPMNVGVIGFDIFFRELKKQKNNHLLAGAIKKSGNVVLFEFLKKDKLSLGDESIEVETLVKPLSILANAAAATAIYPLPRVSSRMSQVWQFKPEIGDRATLPVMMYLILQQDDQLKLIQLINKIQKNDWQIFLSNRQENNSAQSIPPKILRQYFLQQPTLKSILLATINEMDLLSSNELERLKRLITLYSASHSQYLNFYGPRHTIKTIPIFDVLAGNRLNELNNKTIFVGFSDKFPTEEKDDFYTIYGSGKNALIAGVEIAATQFSNILNDEFIVPLSTIDKLLLYFLWALFLILLLSKVKTTYLVPVTLIVCLLFITVSLRLFVIQSIWVPWVIPILLQTSIIVSAFLGHRHIQLQREKKNIREAFGYYLPANMITQLEKDASSISNQGQSTFGICLSTDVAQYTTLSEQTLPIDLHNLMNRYYQAIFEPVRNKKGYVSDVVGDAMLAVWLSPQLDPSMQTMACEAALDIQQASDQFIRENMDTPLPTRVGLHCGEIVVGNVGAGSRYEYRAVGDIVNTACRLEGLNKILGTYVLASGELCAELNNIQTRNLGNFILKGKQRPIAVYELLGIGSMLSPVLTEKYTQFSSAKEFFLQGNISQALNKFSAIIAGHGADGPSSFYISLCEMILAPDESPSVPYRYDAQTRAVYILNK